MGFWIILLLGVALCFDSFAVSLSAGMGCCTWHKGRGVRFAAILALMQTLMPLVGWLLAFEFADLISFWDHWIALVLLAFLGSKMIYGALKAKDEQIKSDPFRLRNSFLMGLATSIDAMAAGIAMALVKIEIFDGSQFANMLLAILTIGVITFIASIAGLLLGRKSKGSLGSSAEIVGGVILIAIGVKILVEHIS